MATETSGETLTIDKVSESGIYKFITFHNSTKTLKVATDSIYTHDGVDTRELKSGRQISLATLNIFVTKISLI